MELVVGVFRSYVLWSQETVELTEYITDDVVSLTTHRQGILECLLFRIDRGGEICVS